MTTVHTPVDDLIRDFGALLAAADAVRADQDAGRAIEKAIWEATSLIGAATREPENEAVLLRAQDVVGRTARLISSLDSEAARSRRIASRAIGLRLRGPARRHEKA